jgi:ribosomal protein S18 acetylase RimI-like enzyme
MKSSEFEVKFTFNDMWIDQILELHNKTEMKRSIEMKEKISRAFQNSFLVVPVWNGENLIGCGRVVSDGEMYSSIFDVVVDPAFQKQGIGKLIMENLVSKVSHTCIHLTSTFGNEEFYKKLGFKKHRTAFALYPERMKYSPYLENGENHA